MARPIDPRDEVLAKTLIGYSVAAKPGEMVLIHCIGEETLGLGHACLREATAAGAAAQVMYTDPAIDLDFTTGATEDAMKKLADYQLAGMKVADCYLGIRGSANTYESADAPREKLNAMNKLVYGPVHLEERVKRTRWCVMRYPTPSMAQMAKRSTAGFADFYYNVCCVDYARMAEAVKPLVARMQAARRLRFVGGETDIRMEIADIGVVPCSGSHNIPDGECYTAPVRDSVNGTVLFNTPTSYQGSAFDFTKLTFENGKVVKAEAGNPEQTEALNRILDQDEGARYLGEVALGYNPAVLQPMGDTLFDEKIAGSFHMAVGQCYDEAPNGNVSSVHWDMVCIQRPEFGGGEIYFDDELVRKDGLFVVDDLKGLNPEVLGA